MLLLGFIIRIYHDTRSSKCQNREFYFRAKKAITFIKQP